VNAHALKTIPGAIRDCESLELELSDGATTTLHVASFERAAIRMRVVDVASAGTLLRWSQMNGAPDALVGGFFVRPRRTPLGELRIGGCRRETVPFDHPWGAVRACVHVDGPEVRIARRFEIAAEPTGDLLQAGPLLVRDRCAAVQDGVDTEGFSAGARQFDSDITRGRYPRAALALTRDRLIAATCEGRAHDQAGMSLSELSGALVELGAESAINLDGGGSASLIYGGRLRNRPREEHGIDIVGGRPIATALVFEPAGYRR